MENNNDTSEISLSELVKKISSIFQENKFIYLLIFTFVFLGGLGFIVKSKMNPEYKAQVLLGSEVLNLPILKVIIDDINLEIEESEASKKFLQNKNLYSEIKELKFGKFIIKAADEKDKQLNAFKLEFSFKEPQEGLNFSKISDFIIYDITNKVKRNTYIQENKRELQKNIEVISSSIEKAEETELAVRENIKSNKEVSIIGITDFYTDLNNLITKRNQLEKQFFFYDDLNLVYKLTDFSFKNNTLSKVELLAYCIFISIFLAFIFTIYKLIVV